MGGNCVEPGGGAVSVEQHLGDDSGRDRDQQEIAPIVAPPVIAARRLAQAVAVVIVHDVGRRIAAGVVARAARPARVCLVARRCIARGCVARGDIDNTITPVMTVVAIVVPPVSVIAIIAVVVTVVVTVIPTRTSVASEDVNAWNIIAIRATTPVTIITAAMKANRRGRLR